MITALVAFDRALGELALFAATIILVGGIDDLLVDLVWWRVRRDDPVRTALEPAPALPLAVFVPAWDEQRVIGAMLSATLARYDHPDYRLYVGCYPNDPATLAAAQAVAIHDARVRVVTVAHCGWTMNWEVRRGGILRDCVGSNGPKMAQLRAFHLS